MGQVERILEFAFSSDIEFYEKYLADAPLEELAVFLKEFMRCEQDKKVAK